MVRSKRRRMGQNFLADRRVADRIVGLLDEDPPRILEIGPGRGALTEPLWERFRRVLAIELDPDLAASLARRFDSSTVEVRQLDALHGNVETVLAAEAPWQVASNLPYSMGTAILRRLLPRHDLVSRMVVMLQREVAHRVVARPGDRDHGLLALERAAHAEARLAFHVSPAAFRPRPKVVSSVVVLDLRPSPYRPDRLGRALQLARHALTRPRKQLANALQPLCDAHQLMAADLDPAMRPGTVSLAGWIDLAAYLDSP